MEVAGPLGTPLGLAQRKRASPRGEAPRVSAGRRESGSQGPWLGEAAPHESSIILRCAGKAGNTFHTKKGNRLSCRDQEGRWGSEEAVPGPSVFPSREPGVSGDFWVNE